jgi:hypothetical protein
MTHGDIEVRDALRWIADLLESSQIPFMVLGDLMKQIKTGEPINVDKIQIGIKSDCWNNTTKHLIETFLLNTPYKGMDLAEPVKFEWANVPIELKIIKRKYEFFKNPDFVWFWVDEYKIPNPWDKYYKARFIIK